MQSRIQNENINHLMYMDEIKLFAKSQKNWKLIHAMGIYSQDLWMELGIEKICHARKENCQTTDGTELPNQYKIRTLGEKETYKYLGILKAYTI